MMKVRRSKAWWSLVCSSMLVNGMAMAYPLDGAEYTGITRLEGYSLGQQGKARARRLPGGALLNMDQVQPRLLAQEGGIPSVDEAFSAEVRKLLRAPSYKISVLDLSDRNNPVYAEHNADQEFNPGSVGKLAVVVGVFHALAEAYPQDIEARTWVLKTAMVSANEFIQTDHHVVPFWLPEENRIRKRKLRVGDRANLWTYLDWMLSASSNAAASTVIQQLMLLAHFGRDYPVSEEQQETFFNRPRSELRDILRQALDEGIQASGIPAGQFRQGGFFTSGGKKRVPGGGSTATPRALMQLLFTLERGQLIDGFSSLEIKRLLYLTQRRIRFASSPALSDSALYFKSGSLYRCKPEEGFKCLKYQGNRTNLLNSVAIVESPAGDPEGLFYMAVISSNVLRHNAAVDHQTLATHLHRLIQERHQLDSAEKK